MFKKYIISKLSTEITGYIFIIIAASCWGSIGPVAKLAFKNGMGPMEVAFYRAVFRWVFFFIHAIFRGVIRINLKDFPTFIIFSLLCVSLFYVSYQVAVSKIGASLASVLLYTAPAWVTILARIFLNEKITPLKLIALFLTISGVVLISFSSNTPENQLKITPMGIVWGLISGLTYALYYIFGKKTLQNYSSITIFTYILPIGSIPLFFLIPKSLPPQSALFPLLFLGFVTTYLAYIAYYKGLKYLEASRASVVATLEPVVASLLAFLFWDEVLSPISYIGGALILCSVILTIYVQES